MCSYLEVRDLLLPTYIHIASIYEVSLEVVTRDGVKDYSIVIICKHNKLVVTHTCTHTHACTYEPSYKHNHEYTLTDCDVCKSVVFLVFRTKSHSLWVVITILKTLYTNVYNNYTIFTIDLCPTKLFYQPLDPKAICLLETVP